MKEPTMMRIADHNTSAKQHPQVNSALPEDARVVILVLTGDDEQGVMFKRRKQPRCAYQVPATLKFSGPSAVDHRIYTRDASQWGVGFVTQDPLPVGADAYLLMESAAGEALHVRC